MFHTFSTTSPFNIPPSPDFLYPLAPPPPPRRRRIPRRRRKAYLSRPPAYHDPPASNSALDTPALPHRAFFAGVYDAYDNRGRETGGEEDEEVARAETRRGGRGYGFGPGEVAQREMGGEGWVGRGGRGDVQGGRGGVRLGVVYGVQGGVEGGCDWRFLSKGERRVVEEEGVERRWEGVWERHGERLEGRGEGVGGCLRCRVDGRRCEVGVGVGGGGKVRCGGCVRGGREFCVLLKGGWPPVGGVSKVWVDGDRVEVEKGKGGKGFWAYVRVEGVSEDVLRGAVEELMGEGEMNFGAFGMFTREDRRKLPLPGWAVKEGREFGSTAQTAKVDVADEQMLRYNYFRGVADIAEANKPDREMKRLQAEYKQKLANLQSPPEGCPHSPAKRVPTREEMDKVAREGKRLQNEYRQKLANLQSPPEACPGDKPESSASS